MSSKKLHGLTHLPSFVIGVKGAAAGHGRQNGPISAAVRSLAELRLGHDVES